MQEEKSTIFELERIISVVSVRVKQQQRVIDGLRDPAARIEALSVYADLLRAEYELEEHRAKLKRQLAGYRLPGLVNRQ